jgi:hypothetical protein
MRIIIREPKGAPIHPRGFRLEAQFLGGGESI